jgi:hypothetical protein
MKYFTFFIVLLASLSLSSCGPKWQKAGEDREYMDRVAKRTSDSIRRGLDSALEAPLKESGGFRAAVPVTATASGSAATVATPTVKVK